MEEQHWDHPSPMYRIISGSTSDLWDQNLHLTKSPKHCLSSFSIGSQLVYPECLLTQEINIRVKTDTLLQQVLQTPGGMWLEAHNLGSNKMEHSDVVIWQKVTDDRCHTITTVKTNGLDTYFRHLLPWEIWHNDNKAHQ